MVIVIHLQLYRKVKTKGCLGSAFRAPNFEELFFFFVDANHNVRGNPNLEPEDGISVFLNLEDTFAITETGHLKSTFKSFFFDIQDRITNVTTVDDNERTLVTFGNIDFSKILGFSLENNLTFDNWKLGLGATYMGENNSINQSLESNTDYLWSFNLQSTLGYTFEKLKTTFSSQFKYTGRTQAVLTNDNDELFIGQTDAFSWLNASFKTNITDNIALTFGARNILDVVTVSTGVSASAHNSATSSPLLIGNGRSYFFKLNYNLNF